jgi:hypothetical protein
MSEAGALLAWLPLAAAADWIQVIVWAVVIGIGILNQIFGANSKKKPPQMPRRPNAGAGGGAAPGGAAGGQKTLLDEVEKFLQDARQATAQAHNRPPQQQQRPEPQRPEQQRRPSQVGGSLPSQQKSQKQQGNRQRKSQQSGGQQRREQQQPQRLAQSEPSRVRPQADGLEEVRAGEDRLNTSRFDERAGRLSHLRQQIDADIGGHISSAFDHKVGSLTTGSVAATTSNDTPTGPNQVVELVAMLKDPMSMRNAVLMREILEPPSHRW